MARFVKGIILICGFLIFSGPHIVNAATVYFSPAEGEFGPGDSFALDIRIDPETYCVNTVDIGVMFPRDHLRAVDFITGESIISIWLAKPGSSDMPAANERGELRFSGGIPGGYCGRIPGDPGVSNILGRVIFQVPRFIVSDSVPEKLEVVLAGDSRVLINDGAGTQDKLAAKKAVFGFARRGTGAEGEEWKRQIAEDNIPPEPFVIEIYSDSSMFGGKYYIIFNTLDKQTGVDHYEVLEIRPGEEIGVAPESGLLDSLLGKARQAPAWKRAAIPYLLEDQDLLSTIRVKAIDKAGNERVVEYTPPAAVVPAPPSAVRHGNVLLISLSGVLLFVILSTAWLLVRSFKAIRRKN